MKTTGKIAGVLTAIMLAGVASTQAAVWTWTNGNGDNVFTNAANWDNGFPSNETMVVAIDGLNKAVLSYGETPNMDGMRVPYVAGVSGEFEQTGGVLNMTALTTRESVIGHVGTGLWTMSGGEAFLNNMTVGAAGGTGTLIMEGGVINFANAYKGGSIIIGTESAASVGTFDLVGGLVKTASGIKLGSDNGGASTFHVNGGDGVVSNGIANTTSPGFWYQDGTSKLKATIDSDDGFSLGQIIMYGVSNNVADLTFQFGATLELGFSGVDMGDVTNSWDLITYPEGTTITDNGLSLTNTDTDVWSFAFTNNALRVTYGIADSTVIPTNPPPSGARTLYWTGNGGDTSSSNAANWNVDVAGTEATWGIYDGDTLFVGHNDINAADFISEVNYDGDALYENQWGLYIGRQRTGIYNHNSGLIKFEKDTSRKPHYIGYGSATGDGTLNVNGGELWIYGLELGSVVGAQGALNITGGDLVLRGRVRNSTTDPYSSLWPGYNGGSGFVNISGGSLKTLMGVTLGHTAGTGTFTVEGSAASQIGIGNYLATYDGFWVQNSGSTLKVAIDDGGLTPITIHEDGNDNSGNRAGLADVVFEAGTILDIGWMAGVTNYGSFDVMTFGGSYVDNGLALAPSVDTDLWSFAFVDTDSNGTNDTLRVTANAGTTSNGTPINWLLDHDLTEADDEVDNDGDGLLSWEEYVAGTIPTNSASVLEVTSYEDLGGGDFAISWQSIEGKSYSIVTNMSLTVGTPGVSASGIIGLPTETSYTTTVSGASAVFYEIGVE